MRDYQKEQGGDHKAKNKKLQELNIVYLSKRKIKNSWLQKTSCEAKA